MAGLAKRLDPLHGPLTDWNANQTSPTEGIPATAHPYPSARHIQGTGTLSKCRSYADTLPRGTPKAVPTTRHPGHLDWRGFPPHSNRRQGFWFTERTRHKPWFLGRYNEILAFNQRISVAKQAFITAAADAQQDPHKQQKRAAHCHALTQAKRIKRRTFTGWERQYWDSLGQQAEEAEQREDHFALYSLMAKLKVRKANNTQANLRSTSRNPFAEAESWRQHFQLIHMESKP